MVEAVGVQRGLFAIRRIELAETLDDFFFDPVLHQPAGRHPATGRPPKWST